ncbi:PMS1 protein homolog 1-like [Leptopilina heterotoma]|uniref:PMS1 protein homolog 1-like n=1 Tax=Leptopilina heterotoma TaxID=63436 RepID=UPI001CA99262|nr:PMS1 protein homolog 1-like [Leptopilina heterotoma]
MSIKALDQSTAKFLKTSQVITSVSFAVKELVENSLDAGAKNIEINLSDYGLANIEVKDDGSGISKVDAPFMALSSYTSKIKNFEDLDKLYTYGFRGEALQALSEISELTVITKSQNEEIATLYNINSKGNIVKSEPCHRTIGTTVQAKGLFKNFPVRRQTLLNSRRANQDLKYLEDLLKSFAIIHPNLRITYRLNKQIVFMKPSASNLTESIRNVLGKDVTSNLEFIEGIFPEVKVKLMLPKKDLMDSTLICQTRSQFIFVNNRILVHKALQKLLNKKIQEYYLKKGITVTNSLFLLNIDVDPANLDINLEPNKSKGFLKNESKILELIQTVVMNFYQLDISQEDENNQVKKTSLNGNSPLDERNGRDSSVADKENEWPACKKRKVDFNRKLSNGDLSNNGKINESEDTISPMILNIREPVLSESDSNSDSEKNNLKGRRSVVSKSNKESVGNKRDYNGTGTKEIEMPPSDVETLSQLPVVDLGEEFSQISKSTFQSSDLNPEPMDVMDSLLLELDLDEFLDVTIETEKSKTVLKQSTLSLDTSQTGEVSLKLDKDNYLNDSNSNQSSTNSWSRGNITGLVSGTNVKVVGLTEKEKSSSLTGFNVFFSQVRSQVVEENPEMSIPQIAQHLTNRWKEMSDDEKAKYYEIAIERMQNEEQLSKREKKEKQEKEKNKKRLLKMLNIMKANSKDMNKTNETMRSRTTKQMETSIQKLSDKFYRPKKSEQNIVIGRIKPSLWIVKVTSQFYLLDVEIMFKKLNFIEHSSADTNAKTLEKLLKRWTLENDDMSILHLIDQNS